MNIEGGNKQYSDKNIYKYGSKNKISKPLANKESEDLPTVRQKNINFSKNISNLRLSSSKKKIPEQTKIWDEERSKIGQKYQDTLGSMKKREKNEKLMKAYKNSESNLNNKDSNWSSLKAKDSPHIENLKNPIYPHLEDSKKISALYKNFNYSSTKANASEKKFYKINRHKSTSRVSRGLYIQENAKQMLGVKGGITPTKFGQFNRRHVSEFSRRHNNLTLKKEDSDRLPALKTVSRTDKKKRGNTESPDRIPRFNSVIDNRDEMMESLKVNMKKGNNPKVWKVKIPLFNKTLKPKQRSNSENRKREFESKQLKYHNLINGEKELSDMKILDKWFSEKKPQSGFQVLRTEPLNKEMQYTNMIGEIRKNLETELLQSEKESFESMNQQIPHRLNSDYLVNRMYENPWDYDGETDSKYHWTFFPKGKHFMNLLYNLPKF